MIHGLILPFMKLTLTLVKGIFLIQVFCSFLSVDFFQFDFAYANNNEQIMYGDSVLGVWNYTMTNVASPYEKGMIFITKNEDSYEVAVKIQNGMLTGQDVVVDNESIHFNVNIAGLERVTFALVVKDDKMMGESYSPTGTSQILGVRHLPGR